MRSLAAVRDESAGYLKYEDIRRRTRTMQRSCVATWGNEVPHVDPDLITVKGIGSGEELSTPSTVLFFEGFRVSKPLELSIREILSFGTERPILNRAKTEKELRLRLLTYSLLTI